MSGFGNNNDKRPAMIQQLDDAALRGVAGYSVDAMGIEERDQHGQLAGMATLYRDVHRIALEQQGRAVWFQQMTAELARMPRGWRRWLPHWVVRRRIDRRLARQGLFDVDRYLGRYPDVARSRHGPLYHFLQHGLTEQREGSPDFAGTYPRTNPDIFPSILASGLFDPAWYARTYRVEGTPMVLLQDYFERSAEDLLCDPGPLFSGSFYRMENPDTRFLHPLEHYVTYGIQEGRRAFRPAAADRFMAGGGSGPLLGLADFLTPGHKAVVLHWERGNFFFTDIARYTVEAITALGHEVSLLTDHEGIDLTDVDIFVVAPHEYCVHGPGTQFSEKTKKRLVHINTEQWHTSWFSLALHKMAQSKRALDINPLSARGLERLGIQAGFLPLLPRAGGIFDFKQAQLSRQVTELRAVKPLIFPADFADRPYDILFAGALNDRRSRALAKLAPTLANYECFLHAPRLRGRPVTAQSPNMINSADLAQLARNTKILLNIHQGDSHYFEWHRLVLSGIAQGCVPVTEPCADIGLVKSGEHYVSVRIEEMADRLKWLLETPAGRRELTRLHQNGRILMTQLEAM